jgi:hypothetical protein
MNMTTAVVAAFASAAGFAIANSLQHRAAGLVSSSVVDGGGLFTRLLRRPSWQLGLALGIVAYVLQGVAVRNGPLVVVQPLIVTGIVLVLPIRAALDGKLPSLRDLRWVGLTAAGIAVFVVASSPTTGIGAIRVSYAVPLVVAGALAAAAAAVCGLRAVSVERRGILLGIACGLLFGLAAGTLKLVVVDAIRGPVGLAAIGVLLTLGALGFALNQRTYQLAPMTVSMPVLNVVLVAVATTFGFAVFREIPAYGPGAVAAELAGLTLIGVGLTRLASTSSRRASLDDGADPVAEFKQQLPMADLPAWSASGAAVAVPLQRRCSASGWPAARTTTPPSRAPWATPPGRSTSAPLPRRPRQPAIAAQRRRHPETVHSTSPC